MKTTFKSVKEAISDAKEIVTLAHFNPDGDAIGSLLGLTLFLKRIGKTARAISPSEISERYNFLEGIEFLEVNQAIPPTADLVIYLDCTGEERCLPVELPDNFLGRVINIDHHVDNERFGNINLALSDFSSTGEILFELIREFDKDFTPGEANALLVSILTDTGDLHFKNTSPRTLRAAARLMEEGADLRELTYRLFELTTFPRTQLLGRTLHTLVKNTSGEIAWVTVTQEMFQTTGTSPAAVEDFVNHVSRIQDVKIALLFREETSERTKVSVRAIEGINANGIAGRFGGGGHRAAAGCRLEVPLTECITRVLEVCEEALTAFGRHNQPQ